MSDLVRLSKFVSLVLRHQPEVANLKLDAGGWAEVEDLLRGAKDAGVLLTQDLLDKVVAENNKKRFEYSDNGLKIRARQGHSLEGVHLGYDPKDPPEYLYHGTATRFVDAIKANGIQKMKRHAVHLSADALTAIDVGSRHGKPVVLRVKSGEMARQGLKFYLTDNGVWLTEDVPSTYIDFSS